MYRSLNLFFTCALCVIASRGTAQSPTKGATALEFRDGINITKDTLFRLNLRFRMQNRLGFTSVSGDDPSVARTDFRVRRARLRLEGFVVDPRLRFLFHLGFSKSDLDLDVQSNAQVIRDAMVFYDLTPSFTFGLGQQKLPGNRQQVISSGNQQFPDRSLANGLFTLDRDYGAFLNWTLPVGGMVWMAKGAVTSGNGRNASVGDDGLSYTGRLEWLPLGAFTDKGDYFEGDLAHEEHVKVSIGASYNNNVHAVRTGGQLGRDLFAPRTINTSIVDALLKYKGWAWSTELYERDCIGDPIEVNTAGEKRYVYEGSGMNTQLSAFVAKRTEIGTRYTIVVPRASLEGTELKQEEAWLGCTYYLNGHRIKFQGAAGYHWTEGAAALDHSGNYWNLWFQTEFGI